MTIDQILSSLGIDDQNFGGFAGEWVGSGPTLEVHTPIDGSRLASVHEVTEEEYDEIVDRAHAAFLEWRKIPAPKRGEIVRENAATPQIRGTCQNQGKSLNKNN